MSYVTTSLLYRHRRRILAIAIAGAMIALAASLLQPLRYRATMRFLIIQATSPSLDAFTAVKSSEKVGRNLGRIIGSSSFLESVLSANAAIDRDAFPQQERKRRVFWERMLESSVAPETSVMELSVYHTRQAQAVAIAEAIGNVLVRDAREYTGSRDITVRVIDLPIASKYPVRPNIFLNVFVGLILGALLGAAAVYLKGATKH